MQFNGENHPDLATPYNNLADVYSDKDELDEALNYYRKCLAISIHT